MMGTKDPRIDAYIARSADFAKPILRYVRAAVQEGCPDVEEGIRWGAPAYVHNGILCMSAAFKGHMRLIFWKGKLVTGKGGANQFGRITKLSDLPSKRTLVGYVRKAARINDSLTGTAVAVKRRAKKATRVTAPRLLAKSLDRNKKR